MNDMYQKLKTYPPELFKWEYYNLPSDVMTSRSLWQAFYSMPNLPVHAHTHHDKFKSTVHLIKGQII